MTSCATVPKPPKRELCAYFQGKLYCNDKRKDQENYTRSPVHGDICMQASEWGAIRKYIEQLRVDLKKCMLYK